MSARATGASYGKSFATTHVRSSANARAPEKAMTASRTASTRAAGSLCDVLADARDEALDAEQLSCGVARLGDPVGVEDHDVLGFEGNRDLIVDLSLADAERKVVAVQDVAEAGARVQVQHAGVTAVDELESPPRDVDPRVAERHEALDVDELPRHVRVRQGHDLPGLGELARRGCGHQVPERLGEVALRGRAEQRRRDSLPHDVRDEQIEAVLSFVPEEAVEVASDAPRRHRQRGHLQAGEVVGRLVEQELLLDLRADARLALVRRLEVGGPAGDPQLELRIEHAELLQRSGPLGAHAERRDAVREIVGELGQQRHLSVGERVGFGGVDGQRPGRRPVERRSESRCSKRTRVAGPPLATARGAGRWRCSSRRRPCPCGCTFRLDRGLARYRPR